jgi:hypothetical protein
MQFDCGTRFLRVVHGRDARATQPKRTTTLQKILLTISCPGTYDE